MTSREDKPRLTTQEIAAWLENEISTLHPADDFEGPRREFLLRLCKQASIASSSCATPEKGAQRQSVGAQEKKP